MLMRRLVLVAVLSLVATAAPPLCAQAPADTLSLLAGDLLRVRVWPDSSLGGDFPVEEGGMVLLPVVGSVRATGRTLADLRQDLRTRYQQAMKMPVVTVVPVFRVSVLGGVSRPGLYQVDPTMNLYDVVSLAGGFVPNAKEAELRVVRADTVVRVNARQALRSGTAAGAVQLRSGDRIVVPLSRGVNPMMLLQAVTLVLAAANLIIRW